jgi:integrase
MTYAIDGTKPGMTRWAEWSEVDIDAALWTVPAVKNDDAPRSRRAASNSSRGSDQGSTEAHRAVTYLFPSSGEKVPVISDASINKCFALIGYKGRMTGHGSRHTCETLLSEYRSDENRRDMHLAHKKAGLKGVYDKATYLPQKRKMAQWYADYLDALSNGMTEGRCAELKTKVNA